MTEEAVVGCILGTAVGDALGLPYEGLKRGRAQRLMGPLDRHRLFFSRGMVSDDTEHTCLVAAALATSGGSKDPFVTTLSRGLRFWLLGLPAGVGFATLRAILRLAVGVPPHKSGVLSAGNGPSMRSAILGAAVPDPRVLRDLIEATTRITHRDPKALHGAVAVALAARLSRSQATVDGEEYIAELEEWLDGNPAEFLELIRGAVASASRGQTTVDYAASLGLDKGVSGYTYHTVPVAIQSWLRHQGDYRHAVMGVIACGGDTDTTAAIVGGIVGAAVGKAGIPSEWLEGLVEWPRSKRWMESLGRVAARAMASGEPYKAPKYPWIGVMPRNLLFLTFVLIHGLRRLFPPYG